ncbi:hypothetical protein [Prosthecobacter sp.]|uniref:ParE family toxin-like protein n=1 Tax=Prosthecobacter sp. TaxID=1965333 RepID=UPI0037852C4F
MISKTTSSFWKHLYDLGENDRQYAKKAYELFIKDCAHPSLRFKKLAGHADFWSVRVTLDIRAVAQRDGDTVTWFWIGPHKEFDQLFS